VRGGVFPALVISNQLDIPFLGQHDLFSGMKVLLIDEIVDSGKELRKHLCYFDGLVKLVKTATVYKHKDSLFTPDYYISENSHWIKFPYEKD
jgi:hypoxanthine phosphoribosyltransferase